MYGSGEVAAAFPPCVGSSSSWEARLTPARAAASASPELHPGPLPRGGVHPHFYKTERESDRETSCDSETQIGAGAGGRDGMGAKNSKVKKGEKKGAAGGDESSDQVDKTATLPASFKKKVKQTRQTNKETNKQTNKQTNTTNKRKKRSVSSKS